MKQLSITLFFITTLFVLVFQQTDVFTNQSQPQPGFTGAPNEATCANGSGCHGDGTINVTTVDKKITLSELSPTSFADGYSGNEGQSFGLSVSFKQSPPTYNVYGFSMTALFVDGTPAGTFSTNQSNVSVQSGTNNKQYVGHKNATSTPNWFFNYELPQTINQDIIFYIAANGGNDNNIADEGDDIYIAQYRLSESDFGINQDPETSVPLNIADIKAINVFPNPVVNELNLQFSLDKGGFVTADLMDLKGSTVNRLFSANMNAGDFNKQFTIGNELNSGIYLVRIQMNEQDYYQKIMVQ